MEYLYHFTTTRGLAGLIADGRLRLGQLLDKSGQHVAQGAVSLTSDQLSGGHGLPDGREITEQQESAFGYAIERNGKRYCADHTAYRLQIQCENLPLVSAMQYYAANPLLLKMLAVTALYPAGEAANPANHALVDRQVLDPKIWGRAHSWWYCFAEIPYQCVVGVAQRIAGRDEYKNLTAPQVLEQLRAFARSVRDQS